MCKAERVKNRLFRLPLRQITVFLMFLVAESSLPLCRKLFAFHYALILGADVATVAAASSVTSLIIGALIGALLRHFIPRLLKKTHKSLRADVYVRPDFNQASNSSEIEKSGAGQYAELQIRDEQPRKTSDIEVSPYSNCQF